VIAITARVLDCGLEAAEQPKPQRLRVMLSPTAPKHKLIAAIVGPSISCGIFLMLAINYVLEKKAGSCGLMILMLLSALYIAIENSKKTLTTTSAHHTD
jgi:hypothetical protein